MNDPTYVESARALAARVLKQGKRSPAQRAGVAFQLATARPASKQDIADLVQLAREQSKYFQKLPDEAAELLKNGELSIDETLPTNELAAWTVVASAILNLDETISKE
jgi:hypothetical protein